MSRSAFDGSDDFSGASFRGVSLDPGERVCGKQFDDCRFENCSFQEAEFFDCSFRDSSFDACNLSVVKVVNTRFLEAVFTRSKLTGVDWTVARWSPVGSPVVFEHGCVLDLGVFLGITLKNAAFRDCSARDADFSDADLSGCDFSGTDLAGARFAHTNLTNARFETAYSYAIDLNSNTLTGARFSLPEAAALLRSTGIEIVDPDQSPS